MKPLPSHLAALALGLAGLAGTAQAATFTPTDTGSLIAAIEQANANNQPDTIDLGGLTFSFDQRYPGSVNALPAVGPDNGNALVIKNGTIARSTTAFFRLMQVAGADLRLEGVTLTGGDPGGSGFPEDLFSGGLRIDAGSTVVLSQSHVLNNRAIQGGGIGNYGTLTLDQSSVRNNTATSGQGAGIYSEGPLTVTGSTIADNMNAQSDGGGISTTAPLTVVSSTFSGNAAPNIGIGGAIYAATSTVNISDSEFLNNSASTFGSAVYVFGPSSVSSSRFSGNSGSEAIFSSGGLELSNSSIEGTTSQSRGGGLTLRGGATRLTDVTISGNQGGNAGAIDASGTTLTIRRSTISGNSGSYGGIYIGGGTLTLEHSTLAGNAGPSAAALYMESGGNVILRNSLLANAPAGQALCVRFGGTPSAEGTNFATDGSCTALFGSGVVTDATAGSLLGALADNGGPTQTHALLAGNPAIDAAGIVPGADACGSGVNAVDQRGVARPQGPRCDVGAFEVGIESVDLGISKTGPVSATVGDTLTYTLAVINEGPDDASGVYVVDALPAGLQFVSVNSTQGACSFNGVGPQPTVSCELGVLANGAGAEIVIAATALHAGIVTNTAEVFSADAFTEADPNPANDSSSASTQVYAATELDTTAVVNLQLLSGKLQIGYTATLRDERSNAPLAGKTVSFSAGGVPGCSAVTNANGVATCGVSLTGLITTVLGMHYTARFAGDAVYTPSIDHGTLLRIH